ICGHSSGFVYCVTVTGITGARRDLPVGMKELFGGVRRHTQLPVAGGFGISRPEHMKALRGNADAAVVGSAIVEAIDKGTDPVPLVKELLKACRYGAYAGRRQGMRTPPRRSPKPPRSCSVSSSS